MCVCVVHTTHTRTGVHSGSGLSVVPGSGVGGVTYMYCTGTGCLMFDFVHVVPWYTFNFLFKIFTILHIYTFIVDFFFIECHNPPLCNKHKLTDKTILMSGRRCIFRSYKSTPIILVKKAMTHGTNDHLLDRLVSLRCTIKTMCIKNGNTNKVSQKTNGK